MKTGDKYFVRIDYRVNGKERTQEDLESHLEYIKKIAKGRYFIAGGFTGFTGGMIIFTASDFEEANSIMQKDPIIERGFYRYDLFEWNLLMVSSDNSVK